MKKTMKSRPALGKRNLRLFGLGIGNGVVYAVVIILILIFYP